MRAIADALLQRYPGAMIVLHRPIWYSPTTHNNSVYLREGLQRLNSYFPVLRQMVAASATTSEMAAVDAALPNRRSRLRQQGVVHL